MMQDYSTPGHMAVAIDQSMVLEVGPTKEMEERKSDRSHVVL